MKIKRSRDQSFQILASNLVNMVRSQAILYKFMHNRNKYDAWSNKPGRYGGEEGGTHGLCQATLSGKPTWGQLVHMLIPMHTVIIFFVSYRHQLPELEKGWEKKSSYLMPATPLAQSSEPPDAAYCKHVVHYHLYHFIIIIYILS